jgi:hypothetical protein
MYTGRATTNGRHHSPAAAVIGKVDGMRPRTLILTAALVLAGCSSSPDSTAQPAVAPSPSPSPSPYVTPSFSPDPTPEAALKDPIGGGFCNAVKPLVGPATPDPDVLIRIGRDGETALEQSIRLEAKFLREAGELAKASPGTRFTAEQNVAVGRASELCLRLHYYSNPTRR